MDEPQLSVHQPKEANAPFANEEKLENAVYDIAEQLLKLNLGLSPQRLSIRDGAPVPHGHLSTCRGRLEDDLVFTS